MTEFGMKIAGGGRKALALTLCLGSAALAGFMGNATAPVLARSAASDSVYTKETEHFAVFYLKTGVHAIAGATVDQDGNGHPDNVDDVALQLERIWRLGVDTLGFPAPKGVSAERTSKLPTHGKFPVRIADMAATSASFGPDRYQGFCTNPGLDSTVPDGMQIVVENDFINGYDQKPFQVNVTPYNSANGVDSLLYDYSKRPDLGWRVQLARQFMFALEKQYDKGFYMAFHFMAAQWFATRAYPDIHDEWQYLPKFVDIVREPAFSTFMNEEYAEWPMAKAMADVYGDKFMKEIWDYRHLILNNGSLTTETYWFNTVMRTLKKDLAPFTAHFTKMTLCLQLGLPCADEYFHGFKMDYLTTKIAYAFSVEKSDRAGWTNGGPFQVALYKLDRTELKDGWNLKFNQVPDSNSSVGAIVRLPAQTVEVIHPTTGNYVFNMNPGDTALYFVANAAYEGRTNAEFYAGTTSAPLTVGIRSRAPQAAPASLRALDIQGRPVNEASRGIRLEYVPGKGWVRNLKLAH